MKITVVGTKEELKTAKQVIDGECFFDSENCFNLSCKECEKQHNLEVKYIEEK